MVFLRREIGGRKNSILENKRRAIDCRGGEIFIK
jgi:hypothetical protein